MKNPQKQWFVLPEKETGMIGSTEKVISPEKKTEVITDTGPKP